MFPPKPRVKPERNIYGDFVVSKMVIREEKVVIPKNEDEEEEEEESEESEEEQPAQAEPEEEVKKGKLSAKMACQFLPTHFNIVSLLYHLAPVKILSKKE